MGQTDSISKTNLCDLYGNRFKGRLDPFFKRPLKILKPLRRLVPDHPVALVQAAAEEKKATPAPTTLSSKSTKSKSSVDNETTATTTNVVAPSSKEAETPVVKGPTILRQLINLGKRGTEVGSEGQWDEEAIPSETATKLEDARRKQNMITRMLLNKRQSSSWDQHLDSGRVKKVKAPKETDGYGWSSEMDGERRRNPFQAFQNSWNPGSK